MCKTSMNDLENKHNLSKVDLNAFETQGSTNNLNGLIKESLMQNDDYYKFLEQEIMML